MTQAKAVHGVAFVQSISNQNLVPFGFPALSAWEGNLQASINVYQKTMTTKIRYPSYFGTHTIPPAGIIDVYQKSMITNNLLLVL